VVGGGRVSLGGGLLGDEAFRWEGGSIAGLGDIGQGGVSSTAFAVSADGSVVVGRANDSPTNSTDGNKAFRWENGVLQGLGVLPGKNTSWAWDVSHAGTVVVGESRRAFVADEQAFRWEGGTMVGLGFLPGGSQSSARGVSADGSVVVGQSHSAAYPTWEAFRWENGVMQGLGSLPGTVFGSQAEDVSADGSIIVGGAFNSSGFLEAFSWTGGVMTGLGDLPGGSDISLAFAVSANGGLVVGRGTPAGCSEFLDCGEAFLWTPEDGLQNLKTYLETELGLDLTGWTLSEARGVSDDGLTIVGRGTNPDGALEGWIVVIPEPSTAALLGLGLAAISSFRTRGRRTRGLRPRCRRE
jgi:probable HAF family extracellular repeat protein